MIQFKNMQELITLAKRKRVALHEIVIAKEAEDSQVKREDVVAHMAHNWLVMQASIERGIRNREKSVSGLTGGDARRLYAYRENGYLGKAALMAAAYAVGVNEINAVMGRIVACPTAGSCGIVPAAMYAAKKCQGAKDEDIVNALFTAAGIGMVVDQNASIAGAQGGCQAECGTAAGMAAGALTELAGGTPEMVGNAAALSIKNLLGLTCDPVAGLVEVPCVKRNGFAVINAMLAADMTLAGVHSMIPIDDVIAAMDETGKALPKSLRETSEGGLATTRTGQALARRIYPD